MRMFILDILHPRYISMVISGKEMFFRMEQRRPISELYAKLPKEKELVNLEFAVHQVIDQLGKESEGLRKIQSFFDLDKAVDEPLDDDEIDYCADVFLDMKLDEADLPKELKNTIATNAALMLRARIDKLRKDLEWKMTKATSDALKG